ncbi:MAG: beta strand repeat-containing protein, partial [Luteolibacter sp.]
MEKKHRPTTPRLLALNLFLGSTAWAALPLTITNPSFEDSSSGTPSGWTDVNGGADAFAPGTGQYDPLTKIPDGSVVASIFDGAAGDGISQTLAATLQPDNTYTLTVQIGVPADAAFAGYTIQLLAGGNVLAQDDNTQTPASGDFTAATATYVYEAGDAALIGQPLEIRLLGKGLVGGLSDVNFDNVQLTVTLGNPLAVAGGPYTAFVGGSLVLNGSGSVPSDGQTITSYEWDLDNDGDFDEAITGASPAAIPQADLVATYGMSSGTNTIKLRVTDSAAKTSTVEATVKILPATAVVYEPFAYSQATLNGASGTNEKGFSDPWVAHNDTKLGANLPYGSLLSQGAGVGNLTGGQNRFGGSRALDASALAGNGLLEDGATLWFSVNMGYGSGGNRTNARLMLMLGTESLLAAPTGARYYFPTPGATGLGVFLCRYTSGIARNGIMVATHVRDSSFGENTNVNNATFQNHVYGTGLGTSILPSTPNTNVDYAFIVGRIQWGAESDTIELFRPDQNMVVDLNNPHSTLTVDVDQSGYDTISFARGDIVVMDEIRFGATYSSVTPTGSYWDLNGDVAGAGSEAPSGTWGTDSNWTTEPGGTAATGPWSPGRTAVFSAGNDATGAYTISVDGTQDIGGITFQDGTVNIEGGTALRLTSNADLTVAAGQTASISTAFTEQEAGLQLSKSGAGTLLLSGDNIGVTGGMVLAGGTTVFESPAAIAGSTRNAAIGSTGTAAFGPAFSSGDLAAALSNRFTADSTGTIAVDNHAATDFDFNSSGLAAAYLGAVGNQTYTGTVTPNGTTYRLGGGAGTLTLPNANALTGNNGLDVRGSVTLLADNDYTGPTVVNGGSVLIIMGTTATSGIRVKQPGGLLEINSDGSLGTGTLTIDSGFGTRSTVSVLSDVVTSNPVTFSSDWNLQGSGSLTVGPVTYAASRTIGNNNTGLVTFASITSNANGSLTLEGNGSLTTGKIAIGTGTLTKRGTGTLTLTGDNTYTGATSIAAGTLALAGGSQSSAITIISGATLEFILDSPTTSTAALNLSAGHKIAVNGTPTLASYTLMTAASFDGVPNLEPAITGYELVVDGTSLKLNAISSGSPYTTWAGGFSGLTDPNPSLDFDAGGLATALEWVLGGDPTNGADDAGISPTMDNTTDPEFFIFTYRRADAAAADASTAIKVEYGSDLAGWTEAV